MSSIKKYRDKKGNSFPHLYIDTETGEFWAVVRVGEKIRKKNLKTKEYLRAITALPIALAELGDPESQKKAVVKAPQKLLRDYWADLRKAKVADELSEATLTRSDSVWKNNLEPYFGNWRPDQVKPDIIPDFVLWHRQKKPGRQLVNVYKYLGNLFSHMVKVGVLDSRNVPEISIPKTEKKHHDKKKGRIITDEERKALLACGSTRIRLVMGMADALGMRKMEIVALEKSRVIREDGRIFLELTEDDTKTGLARILPLPKHLEPLLREQTEESGSSRYLFPTKDGLKYLPSQVIDRDWVQAKKKAKIQGRLRMHDWRHTRATLMAKQNINPVVACTILGMTIRVYQTRYLKLTGRDLVATVDEMLGASQ